MQTPCFSSVTRDHTQYFLISFGSITITLFFLKLYKELPGISVPISITLTTIMCSRMVLSLRKEAANTLTVYRSQVESDGKSQSGPRVLRFLQAVTDPAARRGTASAGVYSANATRSTDAQAIRMDVVRIVREDGPDSFKLKASPSVEDVKQAE